MSKGFRAVLVLLFCEVFEVFRIGGNDAVEEELLYPGEGEDKANDGEGGEHG